MKLQSAVDLKAELLSTIIEPFSRAAAPATSRRSAGGQRQPRRSGIAGESTFAVAAASRDSVPALQRSVALGVAPVGREYRLAVRVQRAGLMASPLLEHIRTAASGEVDVRFVGRVEKRPANRRVNAGPIRIVSASTLTPLWHRMNTRPLLMGASVGHVLVTAGTIGAFVRHGGAIHVLSNNHVLANEGRGRRNDPVLQRGHFDGGSSPDDVVAKLSKTVGLDPKRANHVDAALAVVQQGIDFDPALLRGIRAGADEQLAGVAPEAMEFYDPVYKLGRTTGATDGRVSAFELDGVVVTYQLGNVRFDGQIEIEGAGVAPFSDGGDSGSLIINERMEAIGLLFAGSDSGGSNGLGLTYANPIHTVLNATESTLAV